MRVCNSPFWILGLLLTAACSGGGKESNDNNENQNHNSVCGDNTLDVGEECDDGAANSDSESDACRTSCRLPYCGDGVRDATETCDGAVPGGLDCVALGFREGNLACGDDCRPDTRSCRGWVQVAMGERHACGLRADGVIKCWGRNDRSQLATTGQPTSPDPIPVQLDRPATLISAGTDYACALLDDTTVRCWGAGDKGQMGNGTLDDGDLPVPVQGLRDVVSLSAGEKGACAVLAQGSVWCWGEGTQGQLGDGLALLSNVPVQTASSLNDAVEVSVGADHACALSGDGTVQCWGSGLFGKLGNGDVTDQLTPLPVASLPLAKRVVAGRYMTCSVDADATALARCWGRNDDGQLGDGTTNQRHSPVSVASLTGVSQIAPGWNHACAVTEGGEVWCWGTNTSGKLGTGNTVDSLTPVMAINLSGARGVSADGYGTCVTTNTQRILCWGYSGDGEMGPGAPFDGDVPVQASGLAGAQAVATTHFHACALRGNQTVVCWGNNDRGQLGDGTTDRHPTPTQVPNLSNALQVAVGRTHSCALRIGGLVQCWGANDVGQLGDGGILDRFSPVNVDATGFGGASPVAISADEQTTCVLLDDGTAACWGANGQGQLGDGTQVHRNTPVKVSPLTGLDQLSAIEVGTDATCAIRSGDGAVFCWGSPAWGKLGNGSTSRYTEPEPVDTSTGLPPAVSLGVHHHHTCAVGADGSVWCWGQGWFGQLGTGGIVDSGVPVPVIAAAGTGFLTGAVSVDLGRLSTCARRNDGSVWCWGLAVMGQLGAGTAYESFSPVEMLGPSNAIDLAVGDLHACAVEANGTLWCTGNNAEGQLGDGTTAGSSAPIEVPDEPLP